jgi:hypothetical protein
LALHLLPLFHYLISYIMQQILSNLHM